MKEKNFTKAKMFMKEKLLKNAKIRLRKKLFMKAKKNFSEKKYLFLRVKEPPCNVIQPLKSIHNEKNLTRYTLPTKSPGPFKKSLNFLHIFIFNMSGQVWTSLEKTGQV